MKKRIFAVALTLVLFVSLVQGAVLTTATPSAHTVNVDGNPVAFSAYNINGHNYFMLRDVANALKNTEARFDVGWNGINNAISLTTGTAYTPVGGEGAEQTSGSVEAVPSTADVYVNGRMVILQAYNIDGRNYYMLRDLGDALGFDVDWDASTNPVLISTEHAPVQEPPSQPDSSPDSTPEPTQAPAQTPSQTTGGFNIITASEWVAGIELGWNLGNTLDSHGNSMEGFHWLGGGSYARTSIQQMETAWVGAVASRQLIDSVAASGFNAVRIPVTWYKAADSEYNIRADWMARVKEVVDYCVANDMYILLNSHHDEFIFTLDDANIEEAKIAHARIWEQIANEFKDYNEKLAFASMNEPRTKGSSNEWNGGTAEERNNLNILYQVFVDTVRATGGNNAERVLVLPVYGASPTENSMSGLVIPNDSVPNRIVAEIHFYEPYHFALNPGNGSTPNWSKNNSNDTNAITSRIDRAHRIFVSRGIPVIIGEMGALHRNNTATRAEWAEFYVGYARSKDIPCFWWDDSNAATNEGVHFGLYDRRNGNLIFSEIVEALLRGARR